MNSHSRKTILYIACSLDGYIAKPNDDLSFLNQVQKEGEDYGYDAFVESIDTVLIGRRTYDWIMTQVPEFPHNDKETYVISRKSKPGSNNLHYYNGNLRDLISKLKNSPGKNIFIDGGAQLVNALLKEKIIDEIIISVIPCILGDGIRLFEKGFPEQNLKLISSKSFETGLCQLHYHMIQV